MLSKIRQYKPSLYSLKGILSLDTITGNVLLRLVLAFAYNRRLLDGSLYSTDAPLFAYSVVTEVAMAFFLYSLIRINRRLSNIPFSAKLVLSACLCSAARTLAKAAFPSCLGFGRLLVTSAPQGGVWLTSLTHFLFEGFYVLGVPRLLFFIRRLYQRFFCEVGSRVVITLYRKCLYAASIVLDKIIPLDPLASSFSVVVLGFYIGVLSVNVRILKAASEGRSSQQSSKLMVQQSGNPASDASTDSGHLDESNLTELEALTDRSRKNPESLLVAAFQENPTNDESEKTLTSNSTVGLRTADAIPDSSTAIMNGTQPSMPTASEEQSYREMYALVARCAARKGLHIAHRSQCGQSPEIMAQLLPEACRSPDPLKGVPDLGPSEAVAERAKEGVPDVAPPSDTEIPKATDADKKAVDKETCGMPNEGGEAQSSTLGEEAAIMSIWRNDVNNQAEPEIDLNPSWLRLAQELEAARVDPESIEEDKRDEEKEQGQVQNVGASGHTRSPSNLHDEDNISQPIPNAHDEEEKVNFLNLEPSPAIPEPETPDPIMSLLLPFPVFRDELEARLEDLDLEPPFASDEEEGEEEEPELGLGVIGLLWSAPRSAVANGQSRGDVDQEHPADDVWFASRTIHRELAVERADIQDISFGA